VTPDYVEPSTEVRIARLYRMLFRYETDPAADYLPAYLTAMGQEDCKWAIRRLEAIQSRQDDAGSIRDDTEREMADRHYIGLKSPANANGGIVLR
jgi:hypothetical protein